MDKWSRRAFITTSVLAGGAVVFGVATRRGIGPGTDAISSVVDDEMSPIVWLKISADNVITIIAPHAEMGQGIHTTLAMMLADELDADWGTVEIMEAPASEKYAYNPFSSDASGVQITGGSRSVQSTGELVMRVAGASAKAMLLQAAAEVWNVGVDSLRARNSQIIHEATSRQAPFANFIHGAAKLSQPAVPVLKTPAQFTIMGTSVQRMDAPAKVDGSASFGIDVVLPDMKYAAIKAAPVFGAKVLTIDAGSTQTLPGVRKIVNLGEAVAIVADGYWQAQQALNQLDITWSESGHEAIEQSAIFAQFADALDTANANDEYQPDVETGDTTAAFAAASKLVDAEYRVPYLAHATMEPMNCTAWIHDELCELWFGSQNPLGFAVKIAEVIGFEPQQVIAHNQYLGGGFGRRGFSDFAEQAARIALEVPYPVKLIWSREEDIQQDYYRQASISRFTAALDAAGSPLGWRNQYVGKHHPVKAPHIPYNIDNQLIHYVTSKTHVPWGFWRSVDHSLHTFFTESFIDEVAFATGKDPFMYRRDLLADKPRFLAVLDRVADESGWGSPLPTNRGRGIAIQESFGTIAAQVVEVEVRDGKVRVDRVVCVIDAGFAVHPDGLKAQMESGIIYGLTAALYGEISIHRGGVAQSNFHDYPMVRMHEAPDIETHIINSGARTGGGGEPGTPPVAPALANAIFNATGKRIRELPIKNFDFSGAAQQT